MGQGRDGFLKKLNLLATKLGKIEENSRQVAAGVGEARGPSAGHRITFQVDPDDRDRARRFHRSLDRVWSGGENDIALESDQFVGEPRKSVNIVVASFNDSAPPIDISGIGQSLHERGNVLGRATKLKKADAWNLACYRLRVRRQRPRGRAAEQRDELAALHSITSSTKEISRAGISMSSALAVLRLITNSNLVSCWTGRSAGLSPLRMRPV